MTPTRTPNRADAVRQRRKQEVDDRAKQTTRRAYRPETAYAPGVPRPASRQTGRPVSRQSGRPGSRPKRKQHYDIAFSVAGARVQAPGISIPDLGLRWLSGLLTIGLVFLLYTMWNAASFTVTAAEIHGNQRLGPAEITAALRIVDEPIFAAVPAQMEMNLRADYPDLAAAQVHVAFPNRIIVEVVERTPVIAWYEGDALTYVDTNGVAFPPRGDVAGLIQVVAASSPPKVIVDEATPLFERPYVSAQIVQAILTLYPYIPEGLPMTYDIQYGIGWETPQGWAVYLGKSNENIYTKLQVYQAIVDTLSRQGIQPTLISVEHLEMPFYK
ncbi:MAG: FtsQ-type POTRA domain-containing protein [Chloroflexota bacterium]